MANATLTFGVDLTAFNKAIDTINRSTNNFGSQLSKSIESAAQALKNAYTDLGKTTNLKEMAQINNKISELKSKIKTATTAELDLKIDRAKQNLWDLKERLVVAFGAVKAFGGAINSAMSFESAMADVKKVADFSSNAEFQAYKQQILEMSRTIPLSVNELAQISASGGQLGIATGQLAKFTEITAKLSTAFDMSSEEAGDTIAKMMNVYGLSLDKVRDLGDTMNYLSDGMASKAKDIASIMKDIGGTGTLFGLSPDGLAAISSTMLALGVDASSAGTSLNSFFGQMMSIEQTPKFQKAFASIGGDAKKLGGEIKADPQKALDEFFNTLNTAPKDQLMPVLINMFGKQHAPKIALMINSLDEYKKAKDRAFSDEKLGSAGREFQTRSATTTNNLQLMKNSMNEIAINIGSALLPAFNALLDGVRTFSDLIATLTAKFPFLTKVVFVALGAITALRASTIALSAAQNLGVLALGNYRKLLALLPIDCLKAQLGLKGCILSNFAFVKSLAALRLKASMGLALLPALFAKIGIAFKTLTLAFLTNPIGIVITAIAAGAMLIYKYWDELKAFFSGFWQAVAPALKALGSAFAPIIEPIKSVFSWLGSVFAPIIDMIKAGFETIFGKSEASAQSLKSWENAGRSAGEVIASVINWIAEKIEWVMGKIRALFDLLSSVGSAVSSAVNSVSLATSSVWNSTKEFFGFGDNNTNGAVEQVRAEKVSQMSSHTSQTIHDNKTINVTMNGANATPEQVAKTLNENSYTFAD